MEDKVVTDPPRPIVRDNLPMFVARAEQPAQPGTLAVGSGRIRLLLTRLRARRAKGERNSPRQRRVSSLCLLLCSHGRNACMLDGELREFRAGDLVVFDPEVPHRFNPILPEAVRMTVWTFQSLDGTGRPRPLGLHRILDACSRRSFPALGGVHHIGLAAARDADSLAQQLLPTLRHDRSPARDLRVATSVTRLLTICSDALHPDRPEPRIAPRIARAHAHLVEHHDRAIGVDELAVVAGRSRRRFLQAYRDAYGMPPIAHQQRIRLEEAQRLLRDTDTSAATIGELVGYADAGYFSRLFARTYGLPPGRWRRRHGTPG